MLDIYGEFPKTGKAKGGPPKIAGNVEKISNPFATGCYDLGRPMFDTFP